MSTDIERIKVPKITAGRRGSFDLPVLRGYVAPKPLIEAMGLSWVQMRQAFSAKYPVKSVLGYDWMGYKDLLEWLAKMKTFASPDPGYAKLLQNTLPALLEKSVEIAAAEAAEAVRVKEAGRSNILDLDAKPLDNVGHFRRDASLLPNRIVPDAINGAVLGAALDIFVPENGRLRHVELVPDAYRANLLGDFLQAYRRVYTGPEALAKEPDHPLLHRPTVPEQEQVFITPSGPVVRTVPAHKARFRWEIFNAAAAAPPKEHEPCKPSNQKSPRHTPPSAPTTSTRVPGASSATRPRPTGLQRTSR